MLAAIRPLIVRKIHHGQELKTGSAHVIGRSGVVVKEIHPDGGGSIKLNGELWTARPYDEVSTIAPGTRVEVMSIDGATAVVYPVGEPFAPPTRTWTRSRPQDPQSQTDRAEEREARIARPKYCRTPNGAGQVVEGTVVAWPVDRKDCPS